MCVGACGWGSVLVRLLVISKFMEVVLFLS